VCRSGMTAAYDLGSEPTLGAFSPRLAQLPVPAGKFLRRRRTVGVQGGSERVRTCVNTWKHDHLEVVLAACIHYRLPHRFHREQHPSRAIPRAPRPSFRLGAKKAVGIHGGELTRDRAEECGVGWKKSSVLQSPPSTMRRSHHKRTPTTRTSRPTTPTSSESHFHPQTCRAPRHERAECIPDEKKTLSFRLDVMIHKPSAINTRGVVPHPPHCVWVPSDGTGKSLRACGGWYCTTRALRRREGDGARERREAAEDEERALNL